MSGEFGDPVGAIRGGARPAAQLRTARSAMVSLVRSDSAPISRSNLAHLSQKSMQTFRVHAPGLFEFEGEESRPKNSDFSGSCPRAFRLFGAMILSEKKSLQNFFSGFML